MKTSRESASRAILNVRAEDAQRLAYIHHIKAEGLASNRLENVIDVWLFKEGSIHCLYVGEIGHQFEAYA